MEVLVDVVNRHGLVGVVRTRGPVIGRQGDSINCPELRCQDFVDDRLDVVVESRTDSLPESAGTLDSGLRTEGLHKAVNKMVKVV